MNDVLHLLLFAQLPPQLNARHVCIFERVWNISLIAVQCSLFSGSSGHPLSGAEQTTPDPTHKYRLLIAHFPKQRRYCRCCRRCIFLPSCHSNSSGFAGISLTYPYSTKLCRSVWSTRSLHSRLANSFNIRKLVLCIPYPNQMYVMIYLSN